MALLGGIKNHQNKIGLLKWRYNHRLQMSECIVKTARWTNKRTSRENWNRQMGKKWRINSQSDWENLVHSRTNIGKYIQKWYIAVSKPNVVSLKCQRSSICILKQQIEFMLQHICFPLMSIYSDPWKFLFFSVDSSLSISLPYRCHRFRINANEMPKYGRNKTNKTYILLNRLANAWYLNKLQVLVNDFFKHLFVNL